MGIVESVEDKLFTERQSEWNFVGRNKDITRLLELVNINTVVEIFGMMQIGKSRVMRELIRRILNDETEVSGTKHTIMYFDFDLYLDEAEEGLIDCLNEAFGSLNTNLNEEIKSLMWSPKKLARKFNFAIRDISGRSTVIIFLDNLHVLTTNYLENFKTFVKNVSENSNMKMVLTTNNRIQLIARGFTQHVLGVLEEDDVLELLHHVTEDRYRARDNTNVENEAYMKIIAMLCEGLPLAAMLAGTELRSTDGFYKPKDMVEILFDNRLLALSPDIYPKQEQLVIYREPIEKVTDIAPYFSHFLDHILQESTHITVPMTDAVIAMGKEKGTVATTKTHVMKLFNKGVVCAVRGDEFELHGAIRDSFQSHKLLTIVDLLPDEDRPDREAAIFKVMMSTLRRIGLEVDEESLKDPLAREKYIKDLIDKKDLNNEQTENNYATKEENNADEKETNEEHEEEAEYVRSELSHVDISTDTVADQNDDLPLNITCESDSDNNIDDTNDSQEATNETFSQVGPPAISWRSENITPDSDATTFDKQ